MRSQLKSAGLLAHPLVGVGAGALLAALVMIFALGLSSTRVARADADGFKEFRRYIKSPNSWERSNAIRILDPNEKKELDALLKVLETQEWHIRATAIDVLAGLFDAKLVTSLEKKMNKGSAMIAEGIALSFGKKGDRMHLDALRQGLRNKKWPVRRSCAYALGIIPDKQSVKPLLDSWKKEKDIIVEIRLLEALEKITGQFLGPEITDWENWWIGAEADFELGRRDEEAEKEAEEKGLKAKEYNTVERGVELNYKTRGNGPPLFVLPEYGYNRSYLETYLRPLEEYARIFYIDLPAPNKVEGVKTGPGGAPIYPVDQLVDAFDEIRKKQYEEAKKSQNKVARKRIVIMGHAITCWIAMRFATKYPQNLAGLVLVSPFSGNQAYGRALTRIEGQGKQSGDIELEHYAQSLQIIDQQGTHKYELRSKSPEEGKAVGSFKRWSLYFADPRDSRLTLIFFGSMDSTKNPNAPGGVNRPELGSAIVPTFDVYKEGKAPVPTLVFVGQHSNFTSIQDCQKIVKHYPNAKLVKMGKTSRMPMIEENEKFVNTLKKLLK